MSIKLILYFSIIFFIIIITICILLYYNKTTEHLQNNQKIFYLTYGDEKFKKSRERIIKEAQNLNFFTNTILETEAIIDDDEFKNALKNNKFRNVFHQKRGGGYWLWKPYVIYKNLKKINKNDILIWSDAGSKIPNIEKTRNNLKKLINIVNNNSGIIAFDLGAKESKWTKGDILFYFNEHKNKKIHNSRQVVSGKLIIRKCDKSMKICKLWWDIARTKPDLFSDSPSKFPNLQDFEENRHDQSILSLICKTNNVPIFRKEFIQIKDTRIRE